MRSQRQILAVLAIPTLALATAVHLSDFTPRVESLPAGCASIYTSSIAGCTSDDFQSRHCSPACISGLQGLVGPIQQACKGVSGENLISAFLAGIGPSQICPNAPKQNPAATSPASGPSPSKTAAPSSTSSAETTTISAHSPSVVSSTSTAMTPSSTASSLTVESSSTIPSIVNLSTSSGTPYPGPTTSSSTSSSSTTSSKGNEQTNISDHSGGGSPFDSQANMASAATSLTISALAFFVSTGAVLFSLSR